MIEMIVDTALSEVPVNAAPLVDSALSIQASVAHNAAGMALQWNFVTSAGAFSQTAVTPTTGGNYDWTVQGSGMYTIEIPASGGASINNNTEGYGWFSGSATGVIPWRGPFIKFRKADDVSDVSYFTIVRGSTSQTIEFGILDATSKKRLTGLLYNTSGLTAYFYRQNAAGSTAITLADMTVGTWASGGFKVIDATNMPGFYQLGVPNAAIASSTGIDRVSIYLHGASNMAPKIVHIDLVDSVVLGTDSRVLVSANENVPAAIKVVNATTIQGDGSAGNKWRPV